MPVSFKGKGGLKKKSTKSAVQNLDDKDNWERH